MAQFLLQNHFQIVKVIRSGLRLPWVELKWYFITYRRFKWGQPEMFWPKILIVKNSEFKNNPRKSLKKWIFSSTFPVQKKKKYRTIHRIQRILEPLGTLKLYGITCIPRLFWKPPAPLHNKSKFEIFQPSFWYWGRGRGVIASDGASINSGIKGGIAAKFREEDWLSWLYFLWCLSHWLEFVIYDSFHEHLQSIKQCSHDLFYFYKKI